MTELRSERVIHLFPLHGILVPEGRLTLRIFEPRYLDLVSDCMKREQPFGVALISEGEETGRAAQCHDLGTLAHISDWDQQADGLLEIACVGGRRFRILSREVTANQLVRAQVRVLPACPRVEPGRSHQPLVTLLRQLMERAGRPPGTDARFDDAGWVGCRLLELLPLGLVQKQRLLQLDDPRQRLDQLLGALNLVQ